LFRIYSVGDRRINENGKQVESFSEEVTEELGQKR
jgi:hypothetical protein